jgi:hypothetical protein
MPRKLVNLIWAKFSPWPKTVTISGGADYQSLRLPFPLWPFDNYQRLDPLKRLFKMSIETWLIKFQQDKNPPFDVITDFCCQLLAPVVLKGKSSCHWGNFRKRKRREKMSFNQRGNSATEVVFGDRPSGSPARLHSFHIVNGSQRTQKRCELWNGSSIRVQ